MKHLIIVAALLAILWPSTAKADCSGFFDCLFGFSERVETRQSGMTERERIQAHRDAEIARIQAEADQRVRQADAEVERIKMQRYESEAQAQIAIAQAEQQSQQYKAMITGLTSERVAGIQANAETQIAALQAQAEIAITGITETGRTERYRIAGGWTFATVALGLLAVLLVMALLKTSRQTVVLLPDSDRYELPNQRKEIVDAQHYSITRR